MGPVGDPLKGNTPAPLALLPYAHPAPRCCFKRLSHRIKDVSVKQNVIMFACNKMFSYIMYTCNVL